MGWASHLAADDRRLPEIVNLRAISGDSVEPKWEKKLTITVGPKKAQLVGADDKVLQAAVDYVARLGGGTVRVLPGTYRLSNAVYLNSNVRILGSGSDSVLLKNPSITTKLDANSDWYDQEITLKDPRGFHVGDGICLRTKNPHNGGNEVVKRTLVARNGNRFKLDRALRKNFWLRGNATCSTLFPIFSGENIKNVGISNITLDGNKEKNANLDGNYAGCIFLQDCNRISIRDVEARNYNGDGISWQICHDVIVENCNSHDNAGLGLHPGSGSQRPVMRGNTLTGNNIGVFFCWGVRFGVAENNTIRGNRHYGVSIGHRDTNNVIRNNNIHDSGRVGVLFRAARGKAFAPHRNLLENNRIINSGPNTGIGVDVQGETESVTIRGNEIRESRKPMQRIGVRIGPKTKDIKLTGNRISGLSSDVAFLRAMEIPFGMDSTPEMIEQFRKTFEHDRLRAAFDGDQIVATFGTFSLQLTVPGNVLPTAGTTVVTVLTTHRRRGILRKMMTEHLHEAHENGEPLAALWASESSIYGRFGYGTASRLTAMKLEKPYARLREPVDIAGTMRLIDRDEAHELLPEIYDRVVRSRPGMYRRTPGWWKNRALHDPESRRNGGSAHRRVVHTRDGRPVGYVLYRTKRDPNEAIVVEMIAEDVAAEKALWQYLFGIDLIETIRYWNQPVDDALEHWLEQPRRAERKLADALWLRPVDVVTALQGRQYATAGAFTFRMRDDICPWNEGVFALEADAEGNARCEPSTGDPELDLTAFALGSVYLGGQRFRDLARGGVLKGSASALKQADAMFEAERQPWCQEVF
eukprot:g12541.t1